MHTRLRYTLMLCSFFIIEQVLIGQQSLYFEPVMDITPFDSIVSCNVLDNNTILVYGFDENNNPILSSNDKYTNVQLKDTMNYLNVIIRYDEYVSDDTSVQTPDYIPLDAIDDLLSFNKSPVSIIKYPWFSKDGVLEKSNAFFVPESGKWFVRKNNILFTYSEHINTHALYYTIPNSNNLKGRLARQIDTSSWLVGLDLESSLFVVSKDGAVNVFDFPINQHFKKDPFKVYHAVVNKDNAYLTTSDNNLYKLNLKTLKLSLLYDNSIDDFKNIVSDNDDNTLIGSFLGNIYKLTNKEELVKIASASEIGGYNTFRFYEDPNGLHWWGFRTGIGIYDPKRNKSVSVQFTNIPQLNQICAFDVYNDTMYIASYGNLFIAHPYQDILTKLNIAFKEKRSSIILEYNKENANQLAAIPSVEYYLRTDNNLIVKSKKSLWINDSNQLYKLSSESGFFTTLQNFFIHEYEHTCVLPIYGGFSLLSPKAFLAKQSHQDLKLDYLSASENELHPVKIAKNTYRLEHLNEDYGYLQMKVKSEYPLNNEQLLFRINNGKWRDVYLDQVIVPELDVGDYTIDVNRAYSFTSTPLKINFTINQKWYKSWWFISISLAGCIGLITYFIKLFFRQRALERNLKLLETESLRSYMNPHFISNSLNSINYYILQNERETASRYIVKFSKLIRKILSNSSMEFIPIIEELEALKNYIEIEQMRFNEKFDYEINIGHDVNIDSQIASFILQPIIENAIWHGLVQKVNHGLLKISVVNIHDGYFQFTVQDNGIGYKASKELQSKSSTKRKSYGMKMIQNRLNLLNEIYGYNQSIEISAPSSNPGTIVTIILKNHKTT